MLYPVKRRRVGLGEDGAECSSGATFCYSVTSTPNTGKRCMMKTFPFLGKMTSAGECKTQEGDWLPYVLLGVLAFVTVRAVTR